MYRTCSVLAILCILGDSLNACWIADPVAACREGLDYVVSQAQAFGIKLILTLTNYYVSSPLP